MDSERVSRFRTAIEDFLRERLATELAKLDEDDPKRSKLIDDHHPARWIARQASQVRQIQLATFLADQPFQTPRSTW